MKFSAWRRRIIGCKNTWLHIALFSVDVFIYHVVLEASRNLNHTGQASHTTDNSDD